MLQDKLDQIKVVVDFNNILDDAEAIRAQAEEAMNPSTYIPKKKMGFKPPAPEKPKKITTKRMPDGKKGPSSDEPMIEVEGKKKTEKQVTFCED